MPALYGVGGSQVGGGWAGRTNLFLVAPSSTAKGTLEIYDGVGAWPTCRSGKYQTAISSSDQRGDEKKLTGDGTVYEDDAENGSWRFTSFKPSATSRGPQIPIPDDPEQGLETRERIADWLETAGGE